MQLLCKTDLGSKHEVAIIVPKEIAQIGLEAALMYAAKAYAERINDRPHKNVIEVLHNGVWHKFKTSCELELVATAKRMLTV